MKEVLIIVDGKDHVLKMTEKQIEELMDKVEFPKNGDVFWYEDSMGGVYGNEWIGCVADYSRLGIGNVYRTKQEAADAVRAKQLVANIARRRKQLNRDWKPDFDDGESKYCISFGEYLHADYTFLIDVANVFGHFCTEDATSKVIEEYEDELEWYFTKYLASVN